MSIQGWTSADQAELDVLLHELAGSYQEHRQKCEVCRPEPCPTRAAWNAHKAECGACRGDAPLTFGLPSCWIRSHWLIHCDICKRCNVCPHVKNAIAVVLDWRERRQLLTRAEQLRLD